MTDLNVPVLLPALAQACDSRTTRLLAISCRIRQVEQQIHTSQYPAGQAEAMHYLHVAKTYQNHACAAIANGQENATSELIFLCEEELSRATIAAVRTKVEQQEFVDKIYPKEEDGQLKSRNRGRVVYL